MESLGHNELTIQDKQVLIFHQEEFLTICTSYMLKNDMNWEYDLCSQKKQLHQIDIDCVSEPC